MTQRELSPDLYVLDTLADDIEDLSTIMRSLNSDSVIGWHRAWGRPFARDEVVQALSRLIRKELVQVAVLTSDGKSLENLAPGQLPLGDYDAGWFAITPRGRLVHANWNPETTSEQS